MSETREFKTESKRLLDLMINSIYTNKEIFLRELISNASDAIDKYHYMSLVEDKLPKKNDYEIFLTTNKAGRTLSIKDNGIGMTYDELVNALGTIAKSGSLEFMEKVKELSKEKNEVNADNIDIIGQFGVGFYSAFMVASKVEVRTRSLYDDKGYLFTSTGEDTYTIDEIDKEDSGTEITLFLRENTEDEKYDDYLNDWTIKQLVKKYSDYVRYPVKMEVSKSVKKEVKEEDKDKENAEDEYETVIEIETLNSMTPIWKKNKNDVTDEEYNKFYQEKYYDFRDPLLHLLINIEGKVNYTALLYIPSEPPYNLYSEKFEKGLQLYTKGVFIMDKCKELIPDYLRFVKGLVDSSDLSLNISREILQKSKELKDIATNVEKKIINRLESIKESEPETYEKFFKNFGINLKFGVYEDYGMKKDMLKDLIVYNTINEEKMIGFKEYVKNMKEGQTDIYYASGKDKDQILAMPQMDVIKNKGYDVLILPDNVDEFVIQILGEYDSHKFKSVNQGDLNLLDKDEEEKIKDLNTEKKPFLDALKDALKDEVSDVIISKRLTNSAVCLVSGDGVSFEMEKVLKENPANKEDIKASKILELNSNHKVFKAVEKIYNENPDNLKDYAELLYNQALLIEGFTIKDPVAFSEKMCDLMVKTTE